MNKITLSICHYCRISKHISTIMAGHKHTQSEMMLGIVESKIENKEQPGGGEHIQSIHRQLVTHNIKNHIRKYIRWVPYAVHSFGMIKNVTIPIVTLLEAKDRQHVYLPSVCRCKAKVVNGSYFKYMKCDKWVYPWCKPSCISNDCHEHSLLR